MFIEYIHNYVTNCFRILYFRVPGLPGVCLVTTEEEVTNNVTVHTPCIQRVTVPCGGEGSARKCSHYT